MIYVVVHNPYIASGLGQYQVVRTYTIDTGNVVVAQCIQRATAEDIRDALNAAL